MNSNFGELFIFLTDLAWKNRITIPVLITTAFLILDIRLQIEINVQAGQIAPQDLEREALRNENEFEDEEYDEEDETDDDDDDYTSSLEYAEEDQIGESDVDNDASSIYADLLEDDELENENNRSVYNQSQFNQLCISLDWN